MDYSLLLVLYRSGPPSVSIIDYLQVWGRITASVSSPSDTCNTTRAQALKRGQTKILGGGFVMWVTIVVRNSVYRLGSCLYH